MPDFRYLTTDVQTGAVLSELPLSGVSLQRLLNGAGAFRGQMKLSDPRAQRAFFPESGSQPGACALAVLRDDALVWGGPIWTRSYPFGDESIQFSGAEWFSALGRRKVAADHTWDNAATETAIADLVADAQTGTGGALGMTVAGTTGLTVTDSVLAADRKWAGDAIKAVLKGAGTAGVDYRTSAQYSGAAIVPILTLGSPLLGRDGPTSALTVAEPINGTWSEDATQWGTTAYASSRGSAATALTTVVTNSAALAAGYPRWDMEYASDADATTAGLTASAQAFVDARGPGGTFGSLVCRASDPDVSSIQLGDTIMVTLAPCPRFPAGIAQDARVTGWTLTPGEGGGLDQLAVELTGVAS